MRLTLLAAQPVLKLFSVNQNLAANPNDGVVKAITWNDAFGGRAGLGAKNQITQGRFSECGESFA